MERRFKDLANAWGAKNGINIVLAEWDKNCGSGIICISNIEVYYSNLQELDKVMNQYGCCVWTLDESNCIDERAKLDIWIRLK